MAELKELENALRFFHANNEWDKAAMIADEIERHPEYAQTQVETVTPTLVEDVPPIETQSTQSRQEKTLDSVMGTGKLREFIRPDLPKPLKGAVEILDQFSSGMVDTLDDFSRLMGVEPMQKEWIEQPETGAEEIARFTGSFFTPATPAGTAAAQGMTALMKTPGLISKAQRVKNMLQPIANITKQSVSFVGEVLSSVPREILEKAIDNPQLLRKSFEGPKTWRKIGEKVQNSLNYVKTQAKRSVSNEIKALQNIDTLMDTEKYLNSLYDLVSDTVKGRVETIPDIGKRIIGRIENQLVDLATDPKFKGKVLPTELHGIKKQIDNLVKWDSETVKKLGDDGSRILKDLRNIINKDLRNISNDYAKANDQFKRIADIQKTLGTRLKDKKLATNIKSISKSGDEYELNILKDLNELAPKPLKFMDDIDAADMNEIFKQLYPGQGGGSGNPQGVANIFRALTAMKTGGLTAPFVSPKIQKEIIKRAPGATKAIGRTAKEISPLAKRAAVQIGAEIKEDSK